MRMTGIGLALYLFLHIWSVGQVQRGGETFNATMRGYNSPLWWACEYLLLLAVLYHMFNGLRLIAADFLNLTEAQSKMLWLVVLLVAHIGGACIFVFFPGVIDVVRGIL